MTAPTPERPEQEREPDTKGCSHDWHHTDCPDCGARWEATARVAGWYPPEYGYRSTSAPPAPQQEREREEACTELWEGDEYVVTIGPKNGRTWHTHGPVGMSMHRRDAEAVARWLNNGGLAALRARPEPSAPAAEDECCPWPGTNRCCQFNRTPDAPISARKSLARQAVTPKAVKNPAGIISAPAAAPEEEEEEFDEDTAIMVCGHPGREWSSEWRQCMACAPGVQGEEDRRSRADSQQRSPRPSTGGEVDAAPSKTPGAATPQEGAERERIAHVLCEFAQAIEGEVLPHELETYADRILALRPVAVPTGEEIVGELHAMSTMVAVVQGYAEIQELGLPVPPDVWTRVHGAAVRIREGMDAIRAHVRPGAGEP